MLARLQQLTTVGGALLALLWAAGCWQIGHAGWGLAGAACIVAAYAAVLALEFLLLRWAHEGDPTPKARPSQLFAAWWAETLAAPRVFCWRQPFRSRRWPDDLPTGAQGRCGLLLVHGFVCNRGLWNNWLRRLAAQGVPMVAVNLEPVFGSIDEYIAVIDEGVRKLEECTGLPPLVVAHSMGGLALRRWWVEPGNVARVQHAFTLGTPHHGTGLARLAWTPNGRQMRRNSSWLHELAAREPPGLAARFTCFYSHCDNIVFPPATATLAGADNRHLPGVAHVQMVDRNEPREAVWIALHAAPEH